jgi:Ca-activated chloride channel family protein
MLFVIIANLAVIMILNLIPRLYSEARAIQFDDWQYKYQPVDAAEPEMSLADHFRHAPFYLILLWFVVESFRIILLFNKLHFFVFTSFIVALIASVSGPMVSSITDQGVRSAELSYAVGGAMDIDNFRYNLACGYLPQPSDVTYEGLFYDYRFDTGKSNNEESGQNALFRPTWSTAISRNPLTGEVGRYLAVGLKSSLKAAEFRRKKLNLVVVLDISYSMSSSFKRYFYGGNRDRVRMSAEDRKMTKLESACQSIVAMLKHLEPDDRLGIVLFDHRGFVAKPVSLVGQTNMEALRNHILDLKPDGGTDMEEGLVLGESLLEPFTGCNAQEYENRIIFLTDAMPNTADTSESGLLGITRRLAKSGIFISFIGMGVDFNSQLINSITRVKGANYYSVHCPDDFRKRLDDEFEYMVTPMIFNLSLTFRSKGYRIKRVIGSPEADMATGRIMQVKTLFPAPGNEKGGKGGIILLELEKISENPVVNLLVNYEDRSANDFEVVDTVSFNDCGNEFYDDASIRKAILLTHYADLLKETATLKHRRIGPADSTVINAANTTDGSGWSYWERSGRPIRVVQPEKGYIAEFLRHFRSEMSVIGDASLDRECEVLRDLDKLVGKSEI